ncbi:hypothetical protein DLR69_15530 [Vibrio paracholerae]|uniref:Glycosyltransferase n=1 Tax=Vibrio paracholerae TaxID=650003 RepID=A0ABX9FI45_9VIBR|nr:MULTISPECIES: hypothetical protein [Vibrio]MBY3673516.1 hypothetical protein [Vibrio cholerae]RBM51658.1 hypothetical protein DLR69_15530 [Vibrio paracholerae]
MQGDKLKKGLFISFDGIGSSIFDSQVLTHVKSMNSHGIDFDILAFEPFKKAWLNSSENLNRIKMNDPELNIFLKKAVNVYFPLSNIINALILLFNILRLDRLGNYDFIHARSDYCAYICILMKVFHKKKVVWDCRGHSIDELEDALERNKNVLLYVYGKYLRACCLQMVSYLRRHAEFGVFVSEALFTSHRLCRQSILYEIIPCSVNENLFYFDSELRAKVRCNLGYVESDNVFLYSGSMISYQNISSQVGIYKAILENDASAKILVLTTDLAVAKNLLSDIDGPRVNIISSSFNEMNLYYNASDFAFLLRENKVLNYVASPTKFGEYCLCGLPVIMNDTVEQAMTISKIINNHVNVENIVNEKFAVSKRSEIAKQAVPYFGRKEVNLKYIGLYNSINKVEL